MPTHIKLENFVYSELARLLATRSEKEGFTFLVVEGRRVCEWQSSEIFYGPFRGFVVPLQPLHGPLFITAPKIF